MTADSWVCNEINRKMFFYNFLFIEKKNVIKILKTLINELGIPFLIWYIIVIGLSMYIT